ncbi:hypothetical protein A9264_08910 [Vibrio sp. UCD-FRSSP16_10]|uniref:choice-of-anchor F family protein n=1 Tax=unclassified Vibrio TaxID=2614977 RepID=UPI00080040D8|nr:MULTISPECIES: choice-of-anchor F family protein [unclassified Vibrio]OBT09380.1 hypothetical protein A9260_06010 [Vibrio sp. UCD-FRSSP16_30]OBT22060.1 hypothetical protein A9264_08910 [Vibrio sp. UCD-FRSSP16_10]
MNKSRIERTTMNTIGLVVSSLFLAASAHAAIIQNSNPNTLADAFIGDCGVPGELTACIGGWNLDNIDITLKYEDGIEFGSFDKPTGTYSLMTYGDYFESSVLGEDNQPLASITGKDWPIGEPNAIKIVNDDLSVSHGKPQNCIIGSSFLSAEDSEVEDANLLDSTHPQPVICSSTFQTHKRFKVAMLPDSVEDITEGEGHGIDLVFNVTDDGNDALRSYQVFSKINNYTGKRLGGFKLIIGTGKGSAFVSASEQGITDRLHLSLGKGEGGSGGQGNLTYDGSDLFESHKLATFSHGLFGAPDKHFTDNGFFDERTAGYEVEQGCVSDAADACPTFANPLFTEVTLIQTDMIASTTALESNYHQTSAETEGQGLPFGEWLPSKWEPSAVFFDDDSNPETDASLMAWWDGTNWRGNYDDGFMVIDQAEIDWLAANPYGLYELGGIEDVLNLGINYIVKIGDGIPDGAFTLRIIPMVAANQASPSWCTGIFGGCYEPPYGAVTTADESIIEADEAEAIAPEVSKGGGCTVSKGGRLDPMLFILFMIALAHVVYKHSYTPAKAK